MFCYYGICFPYTSSVLVVANWILWNEGVEKMASYHPMSFDQVIASGPGLEKNGVPQGQPANFTVDTRKAGKAPLKIYGEDVNGKPIDIKVKDNGDGTYDCQYKPKEPIKHTVIVTFGGCNVPKSPFRVSII